MSNQQTPSRTPTDSSQQGPNKPDSIQIEAKLARGSNSSIVSRNNQSINVNEQNGQIGNVFYQHGVQDSSVNNHIESERQQSLDLCRASFQTNNSPLSPHSQIRQYQYHPVSVQCQPALSNLMQRYRGSNQFRTVGASCKDKNDAASVENCPNSADKVFDFSSNANRQHTSHTFEIFEGNGDSNTNLSETVQESQGSMNEESGSNTAQNLHSGLDGTSEECELQVCYGGITDEKE